MKVSNIFNDLKYGELRHFNLGESETEGLFPIHNNMIINLINQGLLDIYSRVPLMFKEIFIQPKTNMTIYRLLKKYAVSDATLNVPKFILDSIEEPFYGNIIKIHGVYDKNGCAITLNDSAACNSIFVTGMDTIQVPNPSDVDPLSIIYRTFPQELYENGDMTQEVDIPYVYKQALLHFIVAKCHLSRAHMDSEVKESTYMAKYNSEIEYQKSLGHLVADETSQTKFGMRGFE